MNADAGGPVRGGAGPGFGQAAAFLAAGGSATAGLLTDTVTGTLGIPGEPGEGERCLLLGDIGDANLGDRGIGKKNGPSAGNPGGIGLRLARCPWMRAELARTLSAAWLS